MYLLCFEDIQASHSGAMSAPKSTNKNNYGIRAAIGWSKWRKSHQHGSKVGPKGIPKSNKNLVKSKSGPQAVLLGVLGGLQINKIVPQDTKIAPRDVKMHLPGVRKAIPGSQNGTTSFFR